MRVPNVLSAILLGMGLVAGLIAAPAPTEVPDAGKIARLIEQLGSDSFTERQKASEALDAIGEPALEGLRKATASQDAEVRKRSLDLVSKIESRVIGARVLKPVMVHLKYKDTALTDAVADFRKKSGYDIVLHDPDDKLKGKTITLDTGKVTFWNALEQFCVRAGVTEGDPNTNRVNVRAIRAPVAPIPAPANPRGKAAPAAPPAPAKQEEAKQAAEQKEQAKKQAAAVPGALPPASFRPAG